MKENDLVFISLKNTPFEGVDFISPIGNIERVLNDATHETSYLVNGFWFNENNLEMVFKNG